LVTVVLKATGFGIAIPSAGSPPRFASVIDEIIFFLLPNDLQGELNLPWVRGFRSQQTGSWINRASRIENVVIAIP
jgi:hypothetical protein